MNKILLIDDEPDIVRVLSISLKVDGYEVIPAHSGAEGLTAFEKENIPFRWVKPENIHLTLIFLGGRFTAPNELELKIDSAIDPNRGRYSIRASA